MQEERNPTTALPPTFVPNQHEHLNVLGPPMLGQLAMPNAPDYTDLLMGFDMLPGTDPQTDASGTVQVDALLQTDWIDSFFSQQNQGHYVDMLASLRGSLEQ